MKRKSVGFALVLFSISVLQDRSGISFVHYLIEPDKLSINFVENKYYSTLEISDLN